jgi:hypothetical protein
MMVTDFDENNFGPLDTFEFALSFLCGRMGEYGSRGLQILVNAVNGVFDDDYEESNTSLTLSLLLLALCIVAL